MTNIPPGWKLERADAGPFKTIHVYAPNGFTAIASSHARNPENVLYMLADALLKGTDAEIYQNIAARHASGVRGGPVGAPVDGVAGLRPCRSPYCECEPGKCTHPGCYDARGVRESGSRTSARSDADGREEKTP